MMAGRLDHLVVVAKDLDALAQTYRDLGFQVGARNRHDWGTLNHIVQFNGCFLELLSLEDGFKRPPLDAPVSPFANFIADYLEQREGLAMLVLASDDADGDHTRFASNGVASPGRFDFTRSGVGADGKAISVSFSLAFAQSAQVEHAGFFVCQQHNPEYFWFADRQIHANSVTGVGRVVLAAPEPARAADFVGRFAGREVTAPSVDANRSVITEAGAVEVCTPDAVRVAYGAAAPDAVVASDGFAAAHFKCANLFATEALFNRGGIDYTVGDGQIVIDAKTAHGLTLVFEAA